MLKSVGVGPGTRGSVIKNPPSNSGDAGSILGSRGSPGGGSSNPLQYSCLENPHGQRSLASYNPWDGKESDMTEHAAYTPQKVYDMANILSPSDACFLIITKWG